MVVALLIAALSVPRTPRWLRRAVFGSALIYGLASIYAIPYGASRVLAHGYRPFSSSDVPAGGVAIVVLGAGESYVQDWDGRFLPVLDRLNVARIAEAWRVFRLLPNAWVVTSGGLTSARPGEQPGAVLMRDALVRLGVPESRVALEGDTQTTRGEALAIAARMRGLNVQHVVLVTSDMHMRRAIGTFRAVGIMAIPAVARDSYPSPEGLEWIVPGNGGLNLSSLVVHEIVGIATYRVAGWFSLARR